MIIKVLLPEVPAVKKDLVLQAVHHPAPVPAAVHQIPQQIQMTAIKEPLQTVTEIQILTALQTVLYQTIRVV